MDFGKIKDSVEKVKSSVEVVADLGAVALQKVNELLDEYKRAVAVLQTYGFTVGTFEVGTGFPPGVSTSVTGSVAALQEDAIKTVITAHQGQVLLVSLLDALLKAKGLYDRVGLTFGSVTADIKITLPPSIGVKFH
jgi:hypothetical protein